MNKYDFCLGMFCGFVMNPTNTWLSLQAYSKHNNNQIFLQLLNFQYNHLDHVSNDKSFQNQTRRQN